MKFLKLFLFLFVAGGASAQTSYYFDSTPWTTYGEHNPPFVFTQSDGAGHVAKQIVPGQAPGFWSKSPTVALKFYYSSASSRYYALYQDGTLIQDDAIPGMHGGGIYNTGGGTYATATMASGLDTVSSHFYQVVCYTPVQGQTGSWLDDAIVLTGSGLDSTVVTPHKIISFYGDSIIALSNFYTTDTASTQIFDIRSSAWWKATWATGYAMSIAGTAGGKVHTTGETSTGNISTISDYVISEYGINDVPDLADNGPGTGNSNFVTSGHNMAVNITTPSQLQKFIWLQPFTGTTAQRSNIATKIQAAISGVSKSYFVSTDNWITSGDTAEGTHPNVAGYLKIDNRLRPIIASLEGSAVSITGGASTGTMGLPSATYTVTLAAGATFTGDQKVIVSTTLGTVSATAAGGTITNNNSPSVSVTPANGVVSFTFNCTVNSAGTATISYAFDATVQAMWTAPSNNTYQCVPSSTGSRRAAAAAFSP